MIQTGAMLIESVTLGSRVRVQTEQLAPVKQEHRVVKASDFFVLVQNGCCGEQFAVPASASLEVGHRHSDVGDRGKVGRSGLLRLRNVLSSYGRANFEPNSSAATQATLGVSSIYRSVAILLDFRTFQGPK